MPLSVSFQSTATVSAAERKVGPQFQRQAVDYRLRLPKGWMATFDVINPGSGDHFSCRRGT